jgi:hypothetical protein
MTHSLESSAGALLGALCLVGIATAIGVPKDTHFWQRRGVLVDVVKTQPYVAEHTLRFGPQQSYEGSGGGLGFERRLFPNGLTYFDHDGDGNEAPAAFRQWRDEFTQAELDAWDDAGYFIPEYVPSMRVGHPAQYAIILTQHRRVENGERDYLFGGVMVVTRSQYLEACEFLGVDP